MNPAAAVFAIMLACMTSYRDSAALQGALSSASYA